MTIKTSIYEELGKKIAEEAMDGYIYEGKTLREWINVLAQQPCENCISRQAVNDLVDELARAISDERLCMSRGRSTATIMQDILHLPPVTPKEKTKWIPVSERLPENGQYVLFCDINNDIMIGYHIKGRPNTHFSQDGTFEDMKNVRAWMPLPEPYRVESEDK